MHKTKAFTVYAPREYYDGGDIVFLACPDRATAQACAALMNDYLVRLIKRIPSLDACELDDTGDLYVKRVEIINKCRWPFGADLQNFVQYAEQELSPITVGEMVWVKP